MPELPEVEVVKREIESILMGRLFGKVEIINPGTVAYPDQDEFISGLLNRCVEKIFRHGKYLTICLDNGRMLVIHLRMTGVLTFYDCFSGINKHTRLLFSFYDGLVLGFDDQRKFGRVWLVEPEEKCFTGLDRLGPDWWDASSLEVFQKAVLAHPGACIKSFLLNQRILAGLGNIYADEALFGAGINPKRRLLDLNGEDIELLYKQVMKVLAAGIHFGGTSIRDYRNASGKKGEFQNFLQVYRRHGENCLTCGSVIKRTIVAGRGTHYCPECQREDSSNILR